MFAFNPNQPNQIWIVDVCEDPGEMMRMKPTQVLLSGFLSFCFNFFNLTIIRVANYYYF